MRCVTVEVFLSLTKKHTFSACDAYSSSNAGLSHRMNYHLDTVTPLEFCIFFIDFEVGVLHLLRYGVNYIKIIDRHNR
jgi:hypothetical protein